MNNGPAQAKDVLILVSDQLSSGVSGQPGPQGNTDDTGRHGR
jgi:hypothetical protein